jgi:hypothetical protein
LIIASPECPGLLTVFERRQVLICETQLVGSSDLNPPPILIGEPLLGAAAATTPHTRFSSPSLA